jgi:hypothetical protein
MTPTAIVAGGGDAGASDWQAASSSKQAIVAVSRARSIELGLMQCMV